MGEKVLFYSIHSDRAEKTRLKLNQAEDRDNTALDQFGGSFNTGEGLSLVCAATTNMLAVDVIA